MRVTSARDLGLMIRARRKEIRLSQEQLARMAEVSRWWITEFESGKARAELDLVLRTVDSLGMVLDLSVEGEKSDHDARAHPEIDLDDLLAQHQDGSSEK